jgi:hypothetical protein
MTQSASVAEVVRKIQVLRNLSKSTGFILHRSIVDLLKPLSADELVEVGEGLEAIGAEPIVTAKRFDPQGNEIEKAGV